MTLWTPERFFRHLAAIRHLRGVSLLLTVAAVALFWPEDASAISRITPERLAPFFTPDTVQAFDDYRLPGYVMSVVEDVLQLLFWGALLAFCLNRSLLDKCEAAAGALGRRIQFPPLRRIGLALTKVWGDEGWAAALFFVLAYLMLERMLFLPGSLYFNWFRERAFGYSVQPLHEFMWDWTKGLFMDAAGKGALTFGLFGLARRRKDWWLLLGVPCAVLMMGAGFLDTYRVQVFRDYAPLPDGPVRQAVTSTLEKAHVEYEDVFLLKMGKVTNRVNAFIIGDGPSRRVVLYDTLARAMSPAEISNAVAHELGHLKDRSRIRDVAAAALVVPLLWFMALALRRLGRTGRLGFEDDRDVRCIPAIFAMLFLITLATDPVQNLVSQHYERRADDYALELLRDPEGFRSLMGKLALANGDDLHAPLWMQVMWKSHPQTVERMERAENFAKKHGIPLQQARPEMFQLPPGVPVGGPGSKRIEAGATPAPATDAR